MLMAQAGYFSMSPVAALQVLAEAHAPVRAWRECAWSLEVCLPVRELDDFAPALKPAVRVAAARMLQ